LHRDHDVFINGIHTKTKVAPTFLKTDGERVNRVCAAMDFGVSRRAKDCVDRYHFWDYDGESRSHVLSLTPDRVITMQATESRFEPAEFVSWDTRKSPWLTPRDWGLYS
jgi:hypothetical protein